MDLDGLKNKAQEFVKDHGDEIDENADKLGKALGDKFGHQDQIHKAVDKIEKLTPEQNA